MATFKGKATDDSWTGGDTADNADGAGGNDYLAGAGGNDTLKGGAGNDQIDGGAGDDEINGDGGSDTLRGGDGNDYVFDTTGGGDSAYLYGGAGDDVLLACAGKDFFDGGTGNDTIRFVTNTPGGIRIDLGKGIMADDGYGYTETVTSIENVTGTGFADVMIGSSVANRIIGGAGDTISGLGGNDTLWISAAAGTRIDGGTGIDTLQFNEVFSGSTGVRIDLSRNLLADDGFGNSTTLTSIENVNASSANASITGSAAANVLQGSWGNDTLAGGGGNDSLSGTSGDDTLIGGAGRDTLSGGSGDDLFRFTSVKDFGGKSYKTADVITDWSQWDDDRIDLSAIDAVAGGKNNAFRFIGTEGFHKSAGELRYTVAGDHVWVAGDINGDGSSDFMIRVDGTTELTKADFIL